LLNNGSEFNQKAKISSNLILNDGIAEKILIKKTCKKKNSENNNGAKIWQKKTQWGWNLKKNISNKNKLYLK